MTDLESEIRKAITLLRQRYRAVPLAWADDEAVSAITKAVAAAGPLPRDDGMRDLAAEMLGSFGEGRNGWAARVSAERIGEWRERLEQA